VDAIGDLAIEHYHELGKETRLFAPFYTKDASFLPRQARDKHRENSEKGALLQQTRSRRRWA
jgi:hypothetical protein